MGPARRKRQPPCAKQSTRNTHGPRPGWVALRDDGRLLFAMRGAGGYDGNGRDLTGPRGRMQGRWPHLLAHAARLHVRGDVGRGRSNMCAGRVEDTHIQRNGEWIRVQASSFTRVGTWSEKRSPWMEKKRKHN
eukprot:184041-Pyramimonas_sp.AAC.1